MTDKLGLVHTAQSSVEQEHKFRFKLLWKLYLGYAISIGIGTIIIITMTASYIEEESVAMKEEQLKSQAIMMTRFAKYAVQSSSDPYYQNYLVDLKLRTNTRFTIILPDGTVVGDSGRSPETMDNHALRPEIIDAREKGYGVSERKSDTTKIRMMYVALPISKEENLGYIRAAFSLTYIEERIAQQIKIVILGALGSGLIAFLFGFVFIAYIVHRVVFIKTIAGQIADGDYAQRIPFTSNDEIGDLVNAFNNMAIKLEERVNVISNFISHASHEFRTPLTSIKSFSEILLEDHQTIDAEERKNYLSIISDETDRLTRLINNILDIQKIEAGKMTWHDAEMGINALASETIDLFKEVFLRKEIALVFQKSEEIFLYADEDKIKQVIVNLLANALKFTTSGKVTMAIIKTERAMQLSVSDTGPGISADDLKNLFQQYFQAAATSMSGRVSTGLGLSISKEIVEHYKGKIWAESKIGEGSTFFFEIPLFQPSSEKVLNKTISQLES